VLHGLGSDALGNHRELELLRGHGYSAVGIDAPGHGRRHDPERDHRWATDRDNELCRLVLAAGAELPAIVDALPAAGLDGPVAVVGISLGAISAWVGLVHEPRVRAAAMLLGTPELPHPDSPHLRAHAFLGRSILAIHAEHDEVVPVGPTADLIAQLDPRLAALRIVPGSPHTVPEADWWVMWGRVLEWLDTSL
jgi:pimeloyl-ACP methyl ester carboxylesterase